MTFWRFSKIITGAILGSILVVLIAAGTVFAYWSTRRTMDAFDAVDHTMRVRLELEHCQGHIVDSETALRGYLLTGNDISLDIFEPSVKRAGESIGNLKTLIEDPEQRAKLDHWNRCTTKRLPACAHRWRRAVRRGSMPSFPK